MEEYGVVCRCGTPHREGTSFLLVMKAFPQSSLASQTIRDEEIVCFCFQFIMNQIFVKYNTNQQINEGKICTNPSFTHLLLLDLAS